MQKFYSRFAVLMFLNLLILGCEAVGTNPVVIGSTTQDKIFSDSDLTITIENKGESGYVLVYATQDTLKVQDKIYFNKGEKRDVTLKLAGFKSGKYDFYVRAASATE